VAQLLANGLHAVVHPVAEPEVAIALAELGHPRQGQRMQVPVAPGDAQDRPGPIDAGAVQGALLDGPGQVHAQAADLAHRGHPGVQRRPQVSSAAGGPQGERLQRQAGQVQATRADQVPVAVPQPGQHGRRSGAGRLGHRRGVGGRARVGDRRPVPRHDPVPDRLTVTRDHQVGLDPFHLPPPPWPVWPGEPPVGAGLPHPGGNPSHNKYRDTCPPCPSSSHGSDPEDHLALLEAKRHERSWRPGQRRDQCSGATSVSASSKVAA
jgi:hypothetical protein